MGYTPDPGDKRVRRFAGYAVVVMCSCLAGAIAYAIVMGRAGYWLIGGWAILWLPYRMFQSSKESDSGDDPPVVGPHASGRILVGRVFDVISTGEAADELPNATGEGDDPPGVDVVA